MKKSYPLKNQKGAKLKTEKSKIRNILLFLQLWSQKRNRTENKIRAKLETNCKRIGSEMRAKKKSLIMVTKKKQNRSRMRAKMECDLECDLRPKYRFLW